MLSINTNYASILSQTYLSRNNLAMQDLSAKIASGKRINSAKDDAAGLAVA